MTATRRPVRTFHSGAGFTLVELLTALALLALLAGILLPVLTRARENGRGTACLSNLRQMGAAFALYLADHDAVYPLNRFPDERKPLKGCEGLEGSARNWRRALGPYIRNAGIFGCPSNGSAWAESLYNDTHGDETNAFHPPHEQLPNSYAYNGTFFHERTPCRYGETVVRPRAEREVHDPARLILLLESRHSFPDLTTNFLAGGGTPTGPAAAYQTHNGAVGFLFADGHVKRLKLGTTCADRLWSDHFPDPYGGCADIANLAPEYR